MCRILSQENGSLFFCLVDWNPSAEYVNWLLMMHIVMCLGAPDSIKKDLLSEYGGTLSPFRLEALLSRKLYQRLAWNNIAKYFVSQKSIATAPCLYFGELPGLGMLKFLVRKYNVWLAFLLYMCGLLTTKREGNKS